MLLTLVKIQRTQWGEANDPSPDRQGVGLSAEPVADARGSEIPNNSAKVSSIEPWPPMALNDERPADAGKTLAAKAPPMAPD
jgi:hypothetical protein